MLLPFLSPQELTTALCPWLSGLQGEPSLPPVLFTGVQGMPTAEVTFTCVQLGNCIPQECCNNIVYKLLVGHKLRKFWNILLAIPVHLLSQCSLMDSSKAQKRWVHFLPCFFFVCGTKLDLCAATGYKRGSNAGRAGDSKQKALIEVATIHRTTNVILGHSVWFIALYNNKQRWNSLCLLTQDIFSSIYFVSLI